MSGIFARTIRAAAIGLLLLVAALTTSCANGNRQTKRSPDAWLLTHSDITLLEELHARPDHGRRVGLDGRDIIYLDADDYFDDRGMRLLVEKMPNLESVSLLLCPRVTDEGLWHIAELPQLKTLNLDHTSITDRGIQHILQLKNLEYLNLTSTKVSATGLASLAKLPKLTVIDASGIALSVEEKAMLKRVLGKVISFD